MDPQTAPARFQGMMHMGGPHRMPRLGVRFSDGRSAGQSGPFGNRMTMSKDEQGLPTDIWMQPIGGGGGPHGWHFGAWVFPLPPDGPVDIIVGLPAAGLDEASVTVEGVLIREVVGMAKVLWE